jgi:thymidylate synthase
VKNNVHIWDDYPFKIYLERSRQSTAHSQKLLTKEEFIKRVGEDEKFASEWGNLPKIYGEMWRRFPTRSSRTIDQVQWVVDEIKADPAAHNLIVNSWDPEYLYTMAQKEDASRFPICHNMYQVNIIDGKLSLQLYQRSADVFLGVPFNIASYALLTHILAIITGYEAGDFIHTFGDVHIYESHRDQVKEQLSRKPLPFPTITFSQQFRTVDEFKSEFVQLNNYEFHPPIKAPLSVSGGYFEKK